LNPNRPEREHGLAGTLIGAERLAVRAGELGAEIASDFHGREPVMVTVLQGALVFSADLIRHMTCHLELASIALSSYPFGSRRLDAPEVISDIDAEIIGRDVVIVEDIVDTGHTIRHVLDMLQARSPASMCVATCLSKPSRREVHVPLRYVGFEIPDLFVVGYGLDWSERYRNLPFVATLAPRED
jgi:hypoxanthine phosphoribosyltransferase